jgi:hypothetical protein
MVEAEIVDLLRSLLRKSDDIESKLRRVEDDVRRISGQIESLS